MMTTNGRTARDIALEGLPPEQRLKLMELAEAHGIPSDDSLYWMAIILKPESPQPPDLTPLQQMLTQHAAQQQQLHQQVDRGFDLMAEAMEHFNQQLIALETEIMALQQNHQGGGASAGVEEEEEEAGEEEETEAEVNLLMTRTRMGTKPSPRPGWSRPSWGTVGLLTLAGTLLSTTALMSGFRFAQTVQPNSVTPNAVEQQGGRSENKSAAQQGSTGVSLPSKLSEANQERLKRCIADGNTKCTFLIEAP